MPLLVGDSLLDLSGIQILEVGIRAPLQEAGNTERTAAKSDLQCCCSGLRHCILHVRGVRAQASQKPYPQSSARDPVVPQVADGDADHVFLMMQTM